MLVHDCKNADTLKNISEIAGLRVAQSKTDRPDGLVDYKFFCIDGQAKFIYVSEGLDNHATARISFLTMDWQFAPFERSDYVSLQVLPEKPTQYDKMVEIAEKLAFEEKFVRIDLYQVNNQVYFSEITFSPNSGMIPFKPEEWDTKLGQLIELPNSFSEGA